MNKFYILFFLVTLQAFGQEHNAPDFITDSISSKHLGETRTISISLPDNFSKDEKYPVIYVLDGEALFESVAQQAAQLSAFNVIPNCIVAAIPNTDRQRDLSLDWETGYYTDGSLAFSRFISEELVGYLESKYPVSGFSILVGHSNGASFIHNLFTSGNAFQGYVALSQSLFGQQEQQFAEALRLPQDNKYYFVASGTRDSEERLESGLAMDSIYKNSLSGLKFSHEVYTANHEGVFIRGMGPGLAFAFSDYYHLAYNDELIDELLEKKTDPVSYIKAHLAKVEKIYGIKMKPDIYDFDLASSLVTNEDQLISLKEYRSQYIPFDANTYYAEYAQDYERLGNYEKALEYWKLNLEKGYSKHLFYYRRPYELLYYKMHRPEEAISFAENGLRSFPEGALILNYYIAKVSSEKRIRHKKGLKAIKYCIANFKENGAFTLDEAKKIKAVLETH